SAKPKLIKVSNCGLHPSVNCTVPHKISGVRYTTWLLPELFSSEQESMKKLIMDMNKTDLIILGEVRFDMKNLPMDSRALLFLEYPDFILFFLLLTFIKKLFLHCY
ncbi:MAG: hypothetical protein ACE1ZQ_02580, partial [Ignavibacteriaceae bacterium]